MYDLTTSSGYHSWLAHLTSSLTSAITWAKLDGWENPAYVDRVVADRLTEITGPRLRDLRMLGMPITDINEAVARAYRTTGERIGRNFTMVDIDRHGYNYSTSGYGLAFWAGLHEDSRSILAELASLLPESSVRVISGAIAGSLDAEQVWAAAVAAGRGGAVVNFSGDTANSYTRATDAQALLEDRRSDLARVWEKIPSCLRLVLTYSDEDASPFWVSLSIDAYRPNLPSYAQSLL